MKNHLKLSIKTIFDSFKVVTVLKENENKNQLN
ncbi:MAG: hypothetical protein QG670_2041 [Thermoproteota archaeon]|nr:hypothetical protein [Thermoproteota archaeon]